MKFPPSSARNRPVTLLLIAVTIAIGLWTRSRLFPFPPFFARYGGDALWALVVFFGCALLLSSISAIRLALISLAIAWSVEFLQLVHIPWLDALRSTRLGAIALGNTFNPPDLIAYAVGIAFGVFVDCSRSKIISKVEISAITDKGK